jgi:ABC-type glycerol-3-phosphate transport system substrate-binding protein
MIPFLTPPNKNRMPVGMRFPYFALYPLGRLFRQSRSLFFWPILLLFLWPARGAEFPSISLLIKMIPEQETWFVKNVLRPFEKKQGVNINILHFQDYDDLELKLKADPSIDVIKVPMDRAETFRERGYMTPISEIADSATLGRIIQDFVLPPLATGNEALYYIPRKLETRIMVYRISKVQLALQKYRAYLPSLDKSLKLFCGRGMPENYALEADPNQWDFYDFLMTGYVWARLDSNNAFPGKVGLRGKNYPGTFLTLIDHAYQFGAIRGEIPYLDSKPVTEVFVWECVNSKFNVYNPLMFKEGWTGTDLWKAFGEEKIYLSFFTQLDCFFLVGTGENGLKGYLKTPEDVDFAVMPMAASLTGEEFMLANRNITTGGWFWGVGRESKSKTLALKLILEMTSEENQKKEFEAFGVLSARRALMIENRDELYLKRWRNRVLQTSIRQINLNRFTALPNYGNMDKLQNRYYQVLYELCMRPDRIHGLENVLSVISRYSADTMFGNDSSDIPKP